MKRRYKEAFSLTLILKNQAPYNQIDPVAAAIASELSTTHPLTARL